jgi:integrase
MGRKVSRKRYYEEGGRKYPGCFYYESADGRDRVYYVQYRKNGKMVTAKHGKKSHGESLRRAVKFREDLIAGKAKTRQEQREEEKLRKARDIDHLYERYLKDKKGRGRNDSLFNHWVRPYWAGKDIERATNTDAANFRVWLEAMISSKGTPLSPQTVKHAIALFRRVVRHGKSNIEGFTLLIDDFYVPNVNNEKTEDLTPEQLKSLLGVLTADTVLTIGKTGRQYNCRINRAVADMMLLALTTGMRRGEIIKLQWQHVNYARRKIVIRAPKGGTDVTIPMSSSARAIMKRQKRNSMFVFPGKNGGKRRHVDMQARKLRDLAGLPKDWRPFHGLRHYYATELVARGAGITVVSALLGHKSIEITMRYAMAREKEKVEAVELISIGDEI